MISSLFATKHLRQLQSRVYQAVGTELIASKLTSAVTRFFSSSFAIELNEKNKSRKRFTEKDFKILREYAKKDNFSYQEIAKELNCSIPSCMRYIKAFKKENNQRGERKTQEKGWSKEDEDQLIDIINKDPYTTWIEIANILNKTIYACQLKYLRLQRQNLDPTSSNYQRFPVIVPKVVTSSSVHWTREKEIKLVHLREVEHLSFAEISKRLNIKAQRCISRYISMVRRRDGYVYERKGMEVKRGEYKWKPHVDQLLLTLAKDNSLTWADIAKAMSTVRPFTINACKSRLTKLMGKNSSRANVLDMYRLEYEHSGERDTGTQLMTLKESKRITATHWTRKDDLQMLQELCDNFTQLKRFCWAKTSKKLERTVSGCRSRLSILMSEKDEIADPEIRQLLEKLMSMKKPRKSPNMWTNEEIQQLKALRESNPEVTWQAIAERMGRSVSSCQNKWYTESQ